MKHRYASDCHSHSDCSFDGRSSMNAMCERALELGLFYYTVSDHCECNEYKYTEYRGTGYHGVVRKAWAQMDQCRKDYPQLRLLRGIELGQPLQNPSAAEDDLTGREYDFVIGSLHNVAGEKDFYHLGEEGLSQKRIDALLNRYFDEILAMISWGGFDSLAHITYPLRYLSLPGSTPSFAGHMEQVKAVFSELIRGEKALELNTSRLLRQDVPRLPDPELFALYHEMGGRLVTLGADAHCTEDLAQGIDKGMELLKQAGFTEFAVYQNRTPVMLPLE